MAHEHWSVTIGRITQKWLGLLRDPNLEPQDHRILQENRSHILSRLADENLRFTLGPQEAQMIADVCAGQQVIIVDPVYTSPCVWAASRAETVWLINIARWTRLWPSGWGFGDLGELIVDTHPSATVYTRVDQWWVALSDVPRHPSSVAIVSWRYKGVDFTWQLRRTADLVHTVIVLNDNPRHVRQALVRFCAYRRWQMTEHGSVMVLTRTPGTQHDDDEEV